jgi:hypothetical protein
VASARVVLGRGGIYGTPVPVPSSATCPSPPGEGGGGGAASSLSPPPPPPDTSSLLECAICQEAGPALTDPLRLRCGHVFCSPCIERWLDRSAACPTCRAVVRPAHVRVWADAITPVVPQIF